MDLCAGQSAHAARAREPNLALPLRPRDRGDAERFRIHGRASVASRAARLAGGPARRERLALEAAAPADQYLAGVSAICGVAPRPGARRWRQPLALALFAAAARCGG